MKQATIWIIVCSLAISCERIEYYPDRPLLNTQTRMIGHRGGGTFDIGNTMAAAIHGLTYVDGIEMDIQRSADNTIWFSHHANTRPCGAFGELCFPATSDQTLLEINSCLTPATEYTRIDSVFKYMSQNFPEKYISLDMKAWAPCDGSGVNITHQMKEMAQKIIDLTQAYHLENHVMVECETGDFLYYIKKHGSGIETYLTTLGDFELGVSRALEDGYSGVSFQFKMVENITKEQVDLLHRKGLKIQLWLVNEPADLAEAHALGVDFIQTDIF